MLRFFAQNDWKFEVLRVVSVADGNDAALLNLIALLLMCGVESLVVSHLPDAQTKSNVFGLFFFVFVGEVRQHFFLS